MTDALVLLPSPPVSENGTPAAPPAALWQTVLAGSSSLAFSTVTSSLGRKVTFATLMYYTGGSIVATFGILPTLTAAGLVFLF